MNKRSTGASGCVADRPGCWCRRCGDWDLAARFVSGYLFQLRPTFGRWTVRPERITISPTCTPGPRSIAGGRLGRLGPTSGLFTGEGHLPVACTPEPAIGGADRRRGSNPASPSSTSGPCRSSGCTRIREPRSHTAAEAVAAQIVTLETGESTHGLGAGRDVRLTMGGEPTFVSSDDMEGAGMDRQRIGTGQ